MSTEEEVLAIFFPLLLDYEAQPRTADIANQIATDSDVLIEAEVILSERKRYLHTDSVRFLDAPESQADASTLISWLSDHSITNFTIFHSFQ